MTVNLVRCSHLADAFEQVARVNHYMIGIVEDYTDEELLGAEQQLIARQNAGTQQGQRFATFERALDMVADAKRKRGL